MITTDKQRRASAEQCLQPCVLFPGAFVKQLVVSDKNDVTLSPVRRSLSSFASVVFESLWLKYTNKSL